MGLSCGAWVLGSTSHRLRDLRGPQSWTPPLCSLAPCSFGASLGFLPGSLDTVVTDGGFLTRVLTCGSCACLCFQALALEFSLCGLTKTRIIFTS